MPDDTRIREFAKEHGLRFRWRTRVEGDRAYADLSVWRGEQMLWGARTNSLRSEQEVLDILTGWAIERIAAPPERYMMAPLAPRAQRLVLPAARAGTATNGLWP